MRTEVVIPFRDRGTDPLRKQNMQCVFDWWDKRIRMLPWIVTDGGEGDEQFNRSRAYNRAIGMVTADVYVFAESDVLIEGDQIHAAVELAVQQPGLVVPFTEYRALSASGSEEVRNGALPGYLIPEFRIPDGRSKGCINVVSKETLELLGGGYDEGFEGNWYDDNAMTIAFELCAGPTRHVDGPAWHLWHLPGHRGNHLTDEDKAATKRNKARLALYENAKLLNNPDRIRSLIGGEM